MLCRLSKIPVETSFWIFSTKTRMYRVFKKRRIWTLNKIYNVSNAASNQIHFTHQLTAKFSSFQRITTIFITHHLILSEINSAFCEFRRFVTSLLKFKSINKFTLWAPNVSQYVPMGHCYNNQTKASKRPQTALKSGVVWKGTKKDSRRLYRQKHTYTQETPSATILKWKRARNQHTSATTLTNSVCTTRASILPTKHTRNKSDHKFYVRPVRLRVCNIYL